MKHSFVAMTLMAAAVGVSSAFVACPMASASISSEVVKTGGQDSLYPVVHLKDDAAVAQSDRGHESCVELPL